MKNTPLLNSAVRLRNLLVRAALCLAPCAFIAPAIAGTVGPWPPGQPCMWSTNPVLPAAGIVYQQTDAPGNLVMGNLGTGSKNGAWLPYGTLNGTAWQERMCTARLLGSASTPMTNIYLKILDQSAATGKHGWAVILKDTDGKILDFGVRPFYNRSYITPHQWDGTNWVNYSSGWSPQLLRARTGGDYYNMDFVQNGDGTITYTIAGTNSLGMIWEPYTNSTSVAYGNITEIYLNASTTDTTTGNYKWTQFSVSPQIVSPPPLYIAPAGPTDVTVSWPSAWTTSFLLLENDDLTTTSWTTNSTTPTDDGTVISMTVPLGTGSKFFRLRN